MKKLMTLATFMIFLLCMVSNSFASNKVLLRLGWETPETHPYGIFAKRFKELAEDYTNGAVEVKLFPAGQLGSEDGAFKSLQMGTVGGYIITMSNLSMHYPLMDAFSLPYCFESMEHMQKVLKSDMAKDFFADFGKKTGVAALTYGPMDSRVLYNTRKNINSIDDFAGLKYRVPKNEVMIATFKAFGAEPVPLAWSETPSALQTGTVDGGDNGLPVIKGMKFYEIANHLTVLDHFLTFSPLLISEKFMNKITQQNKEALYKAAIEANEFVDEYNFKEMGEIIDFLKKHGMSVTYPDREGFISAAKNVQDEFAKEKGPEFRELLDKIHSIKP